LLTAFSCWLSAFCSLKADGVIFGVQHVRLR
jgi:hypothetical protein